MTYIFKAIDKMEKKKKPKKNNSKKDELKNNKYFLQCGRIISDFSKK